MTDNEHRPWFGPKRIGFGLRLQTWQGWLLVGALTVAVVILVVALR